MGDTWEYKRIKEIKNSLPKESSVSTFCGIPIDNLDRDELLVAVNYLGYQVQSMLEHRYKELGNLYGVKYGKTQ